MRIKIRGLLLLGAGLLGSPHVWSQQSATSHIVLIGDSGKDNLGQLRVAESIQSLCKEELCDLGILAGDNVYPGGVKSTRDPVLKRVFDKYYNNLNIPFLVAMGNHDYGFLGHKWKRGAYQLLHAKKNPLFYLPHYWYIHETPESVFAVIDTARMMWRKDMAEQAEMVQEAYKLSKKLGKWFMVVGHHPYLSNGREGNAGRYNRLRFPFFVSGIHIKRFVEKYVCGKAHFYLSGHDHSLQVIDGNTVGCNTTLVVSGSAASTSVLFRRNLVKFAALKRGYFHLAIGADSLRLRAWDEKTNLLYEEAYQKNH